MANSDYWGGDIPWVSPKDMKHSRLWDAIDHVTAKALGNGTRLAPAHALLLVVRGMILAHTFPVARAERALAFNQDIKALVPRDGVDSEYLLWWITAHEALFLGITTESTHGTKRMPTDALHGVRIDLPPFPEQRAIATALSDVDALLDGLDGLIAKKRDLKQATMEQVLTGRKRLPGFRGKWEVKRLGDIAALNRVNVVPALQPNSPFTHFSLPAFDAGRKAEVELGSSIGSNKFWVPATAVLVSKLNPRIPRIWAPPSVPENAVASTEWLVLTPRDGIDRQYLFTLCSSSAFCEQMELAATGTTGSHQRISPSTALDIQIDVSTDPSERIAIAAVLSDLDAELSALEGRRDKTRALKQGMMQELLTGKTRLVAASSNVISADFAAKPKHASLQRSATKPHNWQINEAVVVAMLVKQFGSEQYPLGRKRCTKLAYLLHRHVEHVAEGYLRKAAGPYNPAVKYKGPEGIAQKNGYIRARKNGNYSGFVAADNMGQAQDYFDKWYGQEVLDWLEQFRKKTNDELELLATVDMAVEDVKRVNARVSVSAIKSVIRDHREWEAKLEREIFSDANIARAIRRVNELFPTE